MTVRPRARRASLFSIARLLLFFSFLSLISVVAPVGVQAAVTACTPTASFTVCFRITYSGADQTLTIPTGITSIQTRVWGAAGGGANSTYYTGQGGGAGGGYSIGTVVVTPAQTLTIVTGQGGIPNSLATTYGGGGQGGSSTASANQRGGSGGGMSAVFSSATKTAANALVIAGGGGGASPGADNGTVGAGGGGATTGGQDGDAVRSGRGGTQAAGGAAATGNSSCPLAPTAGTQFQGGNGANANAAQNEGGGGGGGGYFGGGGGVCQSASQQNGGGGGGSAFIGGTGVSSASTTAGANFFYSGSACAGTAASGGASDSLYTAGVGVGSCYGTGGNGEVVIQYALPTVTLTKVSNGGVGGFTFTGNNGWSSQTITTVTSGVGVAGTTQILSGASTATTITETIPAGYALASVTCSGLGAGGTYTPNLLTGAVVLDAAATAPGSLIACTFTNNSVNAVNDDFSSVPINGLSGGTTATTFTNDLYGGAAIVAAEFTPSITSDGGLTGVSINASGTISVPAGTTAGTYTVQYQICRVAAPTACDTANAIVAVSSTPPSAPASCTGTSLQNNGGFELPDFTGAPTFHLIAPGGVPGWTTTDTAIEIWDSGFLGVPSYAGDQHAELNANIAGTLTQSSGVNSRAEMLFYWAHRARAGTDVASLVITDNGGGSTNYGSFSSTTAAWTIRQAILLTSATATSFSAAFTAVSTGSGSISIGNFLDGIEACQTYITLTKTEFSRTDVDSSSNDSAGDLITYQYAISNPAGNVRSLGSLQIVDDKIGTIPVGTPLSGDTNTNGFLNPGETWIVQASYTVLQADMDAGSVTNTAYASGSTGSNTIRTDDEAVTATLTATASFAITKAVDLAVIAAPGTLTYTITVDNTGSASLTGLTITDALLQGVTTRTLTSGPSYSSGDTDTDGTIDPTETWTYTATYAVTQANIDDGSTFSNTATFDTTQTAAATSNAATTTVTQSPGLTTVKTADTAGPVSVGNIITYTYTVTNTGNLTINGVGIADVHNGYGSGPLPDNEALSLDVAPLGDSTDVTSSNGTWSVLAPGDEVTFTATYTVTQSDVDLLQ